MEWELLAAVPPEVRQRVLAHARRRRFARGQIIFYEGDPGQAFHLIATGKIAIRASTPLGDTATLAVLGVGDSFGEQALVKADARRTATAVAIENSTTLAISGEEFDRLRRDFPSVERFLVEILAAQVRRLSAQLMEALYLSVQIRLHRRLQALGRLYDTGTLPVVIPLTQDDLASMAGTTRPTANRILREAEDAGTIHLARGRVEILNMEAIARLT